MKKEEVEQLVLSIKQLSSLDKTIAELKHRRKEYADKIQDDFFCGANEGALVEPSLNIRFVMHEPKTETFEVYEKELKPLRFHYRQIDSEKPFNF